MKIYKFNVDGVVFIGKEIPTKRYIPQGLIRVQVVGEMPFMDKPQVISLSRKYIVDRLRAGGVAPA